MGRVKEADFRLYRHIRIRQGGFTLVELLVVMVVMAILFALVIDGGSSDIKRAQYNQANANLATIASQLERYYRTQAVATGSTYPPTSVGTSGLASIVNNTDAITAPGQSGNSLYIATSNASPCGSSSCDSASTGDYIYQPLDASGNLCSTAPCVRYVLYYDSSNIQGITGWPPLITVNSMRQQ